MLFYLFLLLYFIGLHIIQFPISIAITTLPGHRHVSWGRLGSGWEAGNPAPLHADRASLADRLSVSGAAGPARIGPGDTAPAAISQDRADMLAISDPVRPYR